MSNWKEEQKESWKRQLRWSKRLLESSVAAIEGVKDLIEENKDEKLEKGSHGDTFMRTLWPEELRKHELTKSSCERQIQWLERALKDLEHINK